SVDLAPAAFLDVANVTAESGKLTLDLPSGTTLSQVQISAGANSLDLFVLDARSSVELPDALVPTGTANVTLRALDAEIDPKSFELRQVLESIVRQVETTTSVDL